MNSLQYKAGYCLGAIREWFRKTKDDRINGLIDHLCAFDVQTHIPIHQKAEGNLPSILCVLHNLIVRGFPTNVSLGIEEIFAERLQMTQRKEYLGSIKYEFRHPPGDTSSLFKVLHLVDPRINNIPRHYNTELLGSSFEEAFLFDYLPVGYKFLAQILEPQRSLHTILKGEHAQYFHHQKVDFALEIPYLNRDVVQRNGEEHELLYKKGKVIEVDGAHYHTFQNQPQDRMRDFAEVQASWDYQRIREDRLMGDLQSLKQWLESEPYIQQMKQEFEKKSFDEERLNWMQLVLSPMAIARIQFVLAELLVSNCFPKKEAIKIAVLERDVPCGQIAIQDFRQHWEHLIQLKEPGASVPEFDVEIYATEEFLETELNQGEVNLIDEFPGCDVFDLVFDVSMLRRHGVFKEEFRNNRNVIILRSAHYEKEEAQRKIYTSSSINYSPLVFPLGNEEYEENEESVAHLTFFLQSIFRKKAFRPGQLPILSRALQNKTVIGLLPTGGGKSLTYQLAALLQPGICIVVDPIRSLMQDQYANLVRDGVDASCFINSTLKTKERRRNTAQFVNGQFQFCFISPERLQIDEFRKALHQMKENNNYFNYCVIDEAHCVSEWGHDFRTSYLSLGQNAMRHCPTHSGESVPLFGLTATASFDVLADVERELSPPGHTLDPDAVIRFENTVRPELQTVIVPVEINENINWDNFWAVREAVGLAKQFELVKVLRRLPEYFRHFNQEEERRSNATHIYESFLSDRDRNEIDKESYAKQIAESTVFTSFDPFFMTNNHNGGIIFCPHRSRYFGVTNEYVNLPHWDRSISIKESIQIGLGNIPVSIGTFIGSSNGNRLIAERIDKDSFENLEKFTNNELNLMVATKAFGMGIDKPNIRFTAHVNYPASIEGFVQEAGRAGRDGKLALNFILFNESSDIDKGTQLYFFNNSFKGVEKEVTTINELLLRVLFPPSTTTHMLSDLVHEETGEEIGLGVWEAHGHFRLYANQGYGFINLDNFNANPNERENSKEVLNILQNKLVEKFGNRPENRDQVREWLNESQAHYSIPGIEKEWESLKNGYAKEMIIPFHNAYAIDKELYANLLVDLFSEFGIEITAENIIEGVLKKFPEDEEKLFDKLSRLPGIPSLQESLRSKIKEWFWLHRDKSDTDKAIYRLLSIGLIEDYTVDYNAKTYTVTIKKRPLAYYREYYRRFLERYYSDQRAQQLLADAEEVNESTLFRKYLRHMVTFIYQQIGRKRRLGIEDMERLCKEGLNGDGTLEDRNRLIKEFIFLYFNSKYSRRGYEINGKPYSLLEDTKEAVYSNWDIVWKYMEAVKVDPSGAELDNVKHLRGASLRLLRANPDNPTLLVLKGFSLLIISAMSNNETLMNEGVESAGEGFLMFQEQQEIPYEKWMDQIEHFKQLTLEFTSNEEVLELLEIALAKLFMRILAERISLFKQKYLGEYV
jgi:ATP-dependent DNA helicase RecQ